jgi:hypothetical protein
MGSHESCCWQYHDTHPQALACLLPQPRHPALSGLIREVARPVSLQVEAGSRGVESECV